MLMLKCFVVVYVLIIITSLDRVHRLLLLLVLVLQFVLLLWDYPFLNYDTFNCLDLVHRFMSATKCLLKAEMRGRDLVNDHMMWCIYTHTYAQAMYVASHVYILLDSRYPRKWFKVLHVEGKHVRANCGTNNLSAE